MQDKRGISNVVVFVLGLVIIVVIVSNVFLWNYEMNQLDWQKMQENIHITNVTHATRSSWFAAQSEYSVNIGSRTSGTYTDTQAIDEEYESFKEASNWWNENYSYRKQITIGNNIASTLDTGYSACVILNTTSLVSAGKMLSSGDDLRIVYWDGNWTELDRHLVDMNTTSTQVWFKTQRTIEASPATDSSYYVYYSNPSAANPPSNKSNVYVWFDDFSTDTLANYDKAKWVNIHGAASDYVLPSYDAVNERVWFDTGDNYASDMYPIGVNEANFLMEIDFWANGSYPTDATIALVGRLQNPGLSSTHYYLDFSHGSYDSPGITVDSWANGARSNTVYSEPSDYYWSFNTVHTLRYAIFGNTHKFWWNRDISQSPNATATHTLHTGTGRLGLAPAQVRGWWDNLKVRKYVEPEPSTSLGLEEQNAGFKMEWGSVTVDDTFTTVNLAHTYSSPIIVAVASYASGVPRSVRIRNAASASFELRVQNPSGTASPSTLVYYIVVEEGVWASPVKLEAQKYNTSTVGRDDNWAYNTRNYRQTYSGNLVVLHQVMTYNDPVWITTYVSRADSRTAPPSSADSSFRIALNGAEAVDSHGTETIGYIIVEQGSGTLGGVKYDVKQTADSIAGFDDSPPYNTPFSQSFSGVPQVLVSSQLEVDGANGGWAIDHTVSQTNAGLMIDEDQVRDAERTHTTETCGFWAFENVGKVSTLSNRLEMEGNFVIDVSIYSLTDIQGVEIQLRLKADDSGEKWYLRAYNWTAAAYSDSGFNSTTGHVPTTGWDYYAVNFTDRWNSYVQNDGTIYIKLVDEGLDSNQTTIDIDFLGVRAAIDGTRFTFHNTGALTSRLVSIWIINSTFHQRYNIDLIINSAQTLNHTRPDIPLPNGQYTTKVITERGNKATYSGN